MLLYHLKQLDRNEYIASVATIHDPRTLKFADMSMKWWDRYYSWRAHGCMVLSDKENAHLCYIFYKIDRHLNYMTIHNIFTPLIQRRKGYAQALLSMVFDVAVAQNVKRFRLTSISNSLDFYLSLGFVYWGVNSVGDYYCNLPIPAEGLDGLSEMVLGSETKALLGNAAASIHTKTDGNETRLSDQQGLIYDSDLIKMGKNYMLSAFQEA
ncbi:MAG: GNAT family N-acetyltransferase [Helicobacteraceae bacterium]|jgi:GNAT superfamily N-acetyltransferase|nr:GNAT family N-acetyltransferase [Helicobacteraceae bacterium]